MSVCTYFISHFIYYFLVKLIGCLVVLVRIQSNSFDVNSDEFYPLRYEFMNCCHLSLNSGLLNTSLLYVNT